MKKTDLKNVITLTGLMTLNIMIILVTVFVLAILYRANEVDATVQIFTLIFTLFTNVITAIVTYYFTRKAVDSMHSAEVEGQSNG